MLDATLSVGEQAVPRVLVGLDSIELEQVVRVWKTDDGNRVKRCKAGMGDGYKLESLNCIVGSGCIIITARMSMGNMIVPK